MNRQEQIRQTQARKLRVQAERLCKTRNRLQKQADTLYERADALGTRLTVLAERIDRLFDRANRLHGNMVRRACLKCGGAFGSTDRSNRLCSACHATNAGVRAARTSPPLWNGQPMGESRRPL